MQPIMFQRASAFSKIFAQEMRTITETPCERSGRGAKVTGIGQPRAHQRPAFLGPVGRRHQDP
ncbi:hypothetical protein GCM10022252_27510 [Streptosporangium oxazolinicum]|uniref:Uncharacterized protein n=1 Tax=Streptosporangium oxazolinicum TaxID=909287 RepID=A0ABP8AT63_9ACTN